MRLVSLRLEGFRGFVSVREIDLDADAVIVVGANGNGKTSLLDGILWALSGRLPRIGDDGALVSLYSATGTTTARLELRPSQGADSYFLTRTFDGSAAHVVLETKDGKWEGRLAEEHLLRLAWPNDPPVEASGDAIASLLTKNVYLQQDLVRHFVEATTDQERFIAVSTIFGTGRVTELQDTLEKAKKAWSTATNVAEGELVPLRERLSHLQARLLELAGIADSEVASTITSEEWRAWWTGVNEAGIQRTPPEPAAREAPALLDVSIRDLETLRRSLDRKREALQHLEIQFNAASGRHLPETEHIRLSLEQLLKRRDELRRQTGEEQLRLAEWRRQQEEARGRVEELGALSRLALRNLGDHCPVCAQEYDRDATRLRLEGLAQGPLPQAMPDTASLVALQDALGDAEVELAKAATALRSAEQEAAEIRSSLDSCMKELRLLGVLETDSSRARSALAQAAEGAAERVALLGTLQASGEGLALRLARAAAVETRQELAREVEALSLEMRKIEVNVEARNETGHRAQAIIEGLRDASSVVVEDRVKEVEALLQAIYSRIDPHPAFRAVGLLTRVVRGKGQLATVVKDDAAGRSCEAPGVVLSSSQMNALATSVFLALNLGVANPAMTLAILDDPLQSLDDINLLGLVDLLRHTKEQRQLIVSTHDRHFGGLLSRKLRPKSATSRTLVVELDHWSREGPEVLTRAVQGDPVRHMLKTGS